MVDRQGIHEQEDWVPKELQGDVGSTKIARHKAKMCRAPLCSSPHSWNMHCGIFDYHFGGYQFGIESIFFILILLPASSRQLIQYRPIQPERIHMVKPFLVASIPL